MSKSTPNLIILGFLGDAVYCLNTARLCEEQGESICLYTNKVPPLFASPGGRGKPAGAGWTHHLRGLHTILVPVAPPGNAHLESPPPAIDMLCKTGERISVQSSELLLIITEINDGNNT
ncbi:MULTISPECIES: hypothetical protein [Nostocales]|uniref:Uncharacterized protein n=3 Tax=Nostocales TaxID=1161 RepID=A0A0C1NBT6_9CYAN|nr:hypothetical protein [Tolypothrix bouteillei]KAF3890421.1 hypothetical protein DA73_0400036960 [Tolypothrix bouteillei VB521301]